MISKIDWQDETHYIDFDKVNVIKVHEPPKLEERPDCSLRFITIDNSLNFNYDSYDESVRLIEYIEYIVSSREEWVKVEEARGMKIFINMKNVIHLKENKDTIYLYFPDTTHLPNNILYVNKVDIGVCEAILTKWKKIKGNGTHFKSYKKLFFDVDTKVNLCSDCRLQQGFELFKKIRRDTELAREHILKQVSMPNIKNTNRLSQEEDKIEQ